MKILIGTSNQGKFQEITHFLGHEQFLSLKNFPDMPEVIEDADTLKGNAIKKALETARFTQMPTISDDTGLEVHALNGEPGVYSARYAGETATYDDNNHKLLKNLLNKSDRSAIFKTVMALAFPDGKVLTVEGECSGVILENFQGKNGFGYDPIFFVPEVGKTFAEMSLAEKNKVSHRAKALEKMKKLINNLH